jgi:hypothetical protein
MSLLSGTAFSGFMGTRGSFAGFLSGTRFSSSRRANTTCPRFGSRRWTYTTRTRFGSHGGPHTTWTGFMPSRWPHMTWTRFMSGPGTRMARTRFISRPGTHMARTRFMARPWTYMARPRFMARPRAHMAWTRFRSPVVGWGRAAMVSFMPAGAIAMMVLIIKPPVITIPLVVIAPIGVGSTKIIPVMGMSPVP